MVMSSADRKGPRRIEQSVRRIEKNAGLLSNAGRAFTARHGFTLIELMIVMSLIVILAGVGLTVYGNSVTRAKEAVLKEDLFRMRDAIDQYYADKNKYPASLEELVSEKYLRAVPVDPMTQSTETWQPVFSGADPSNPSAEPGISDVKSGADQPALDGTPYAEWE